MIRTVSLAELANGQVIELSVGDTLKVSYAFNYKVAETTGVEIWASLYKYSLGLLDRQGQSQTKETITLLKALDWEDYSGEIDIVIGDMPSGTYGLICELPYYDVEHRIDDCLEVAAPPSIWETVTVLIALGLMVGMISMMAPMMKEGFS